MTEDFIPTVINAPLLRHFKQPAFGFWKGPTRRRATCSRWGFFPSPAYGGQDRLTIRTAVRPLRSIS